MIHESREPPQSPDLNLGVKMSVKAANISKERLRKTQELHFGQCDSTGKDSPASYVKH